jgi:hypothetical protein
MNEDKLLFYIRGALKKKIKRTGFLNDILPDFEIVKYIIKKNDQILNPAVFKPFKLLQITKVSHNVKLLRFEIPHSKSLNLGVGRHITLCADIDGNKVLRPYTPTSRSDQQGYFDLLIKSYEYGKMSRYLHNLKIPTFWFWPNVDSGSDMISKSLRNYREKGKLEHVHFFKNMEPRDFLKLLKSSLCIIGNSSVGIRECSYLGVFAINIGTRQKNRLRGSNVIDVDHDSVLIESAVKSIINRTKPEPSKIYGDGFAGKRIAEIIEKVELISHKTIEY